MEQVVIGFPEFEKSVIQQLEPMITAARRFTQIAQEMTKVAIREQFPDLAKQIGQTVANSMESVLLLVTNGSGVDALRVSRTMFEAAIVLNHLENHPELVQDFIDYQWVIQKKHQDYRLGLPPDKAPPLAPEKTAEMESNYQRVKHRFTDKNGRDRNSWCKASLRDMAKELNVESMYGGLYPFGSSMTHTNILSIIAGAGASDDVEQVPSGLNLTLALQNALVSFAMTLMAFDKVANLGRGEDLELAFKCFKYASSASQHDVAVLAYTLWERRGRPLGSPEADWFEAERRLRSR